MRVKDYTAMHELGHALTAVYLGGRVNYIKLSPEHPDEGETDFAIPNDTWIDLVSTMGGYAAEELFQGRTDPTNIGSYQYMQDLEDAEVMAIGDYRTIGMAIKYAFHIMSMPEVQEQVKRLYPKLARERYLDGKEIRIEHP